MFYDNIRCLGDILHHFLQENPELFHDRETGFSELHQHEGQDLENPIRQRLETWLDTQTGLTDPTHRATLLELANMYETLRALHDTIELSDAL